jgi:hypothetical protein
VSIRCQIQKRQIAENIEDVLKLRTLEFAIKTEFPDIYAEISTDEITWGQGFIVFLTLHGRDYQTRPAIIKTASIDATMETIREIVRLANQWQSDIDQTEEARST